MITFLIRKYYFFWYTFYDLVRTDYQNKGCFNNICANSSLFEFFWGIPVLKKSIKKDAELFIKENNKEATIGDGYLFCLNMDSDEVIWKKHIQIREDFLNWAYSYYLNKRY